MDMPVNSIGAVLSRARKKLREYAQISGEIQIRPPKPRAKHKPASGRDGLADGNGVKPKEKSE